MAKRKAPKRAAQRPAATAPSVEEHEAAGVPVLAGRRGQAARNDETILEAARTVFLADPRAPVSAVAKAAGVGISAIYRRWPGKEDLLRRLCADGLAAFNAEAVAAKEGKDGWLALSGFLRRVVAADIHSLTVHLSGTFTPTVEMYEESVRSFPLVEALVRRAHKSGKLRADVGVNDITLILEGCAAVWVPDPARTAVLRQRYLALQLDGLSAAKPSTLPGPPPDGVEMGWRWQQPVDH